MPIAWQVEGFLECHLSRAQVEKGSTAAVFGLGTIGLAVIDALKEAGARQIIGVDTDEGKFERARKWGATDLINPKQHEKPIQARAHCAMMPCGHVLSPCKLWLWESTCWRLVVPRMQVTHSVDYPAEPPLLRKSCKLAMALRCRWVGGLTGAPAALNCAGGDSGND